MANAPKDENDVSALLLTSSADGKTPIRWLGDPVTGRAFVDLPGGSGTVTSVSVVTANGFAGSVATATSTPAITLSTTVTGLLKGNGTAISAATAGTDYMAPNVDTVGNLQFVDATYDIGAFASSRPRNGYFSSGLAVGSATATSGVVNVGTGFRIGNAASSGKILRADGTNFVASTATYPNTGGTSGNVLTSDGTNWVGIAPTVSVSQITGLGTSVPTWLATPSSANLAAALTDETGTGVNVFNTKPTFVGTIQTIVAVAALALDGSLGAIFTKTIATPSTFTQSNFSTGQNFMLTITGAFTPTFWSGITWITTGGTAPTQGAITTYGFTCTGSNTFNGYVVGTQ